ncbi:MAG TPA: helix-turn-helix domain-containing protein [Kineosporiaceae bacterium]
MAMPEGVPRISVLPGAGLHFARYAPDPDLRPVVESYWTLEVDRPPAVVTVIPDGLIDVTFDLGARPAVYVTGALTRPERYVHERPVGLLGVSLLPGAALPVLGTDVGSLPAGWTPLAEVVGPVADELAARVAAAEPGPARLALVDTFLAARLVPPDRIDDRVRTALGAILHRAGDVDVAALARQAAASPRHLSRLFDAWVGMGPKRFARIVRVQAVLRHLAVDPGADLTELATRLGFADHAHLTRQVRDLTGAPPTAVVARLRADDPAVSFKPTPSGDP